MYQSPSEGLSVMGTVVAVSCTNPAKVLATMDRLSRNLGTVVGGDWKVRKRAVRGVEMREVYLREGVFFTLSYAVVGEWLVVAAHPQLIQGFILRSQEALEKWQPDPNILKRLAAAPTDRLGIQYCNPCTTVNNLCCIGPLGISYLGRFGSAKLGEDFNPFEVGMLPNGHELSSHLFPNLTTTHDDGTTIRIKVNDSFSIPLEFIGLEVFLVGGVVR